MPCHLVRFSQVESYEHTLAMKLEQGPAPGTCPVPLQSVSPSCLGLDLILKYHHNKIE